MLRQSELDELVGKTAAVAYRAVLLAHGKLKRCTVFTYAFPPPLQQRIEITDVENAIIEQALSLREATKIPFWEAVFATCIKTGQCTDALLEATFFHAGQGQAVNYDRRDLESDVLYKITKRSTSNVSLCSKVFDVREQSRYLNFLDFHCEVTNDNTRIVRGVCQKLMPQGFLILDSGDSYHASSLSLMSAEQRVHVLGKAILASPIIDSFYIAHQLQQDSSSLRISKGGKAKKFPIVIDAWCPDSG
jgi:hypothetical protein